MKIQDLLKHLESGPRPVVEFRAGIHDKESYAEPNMRARIINLPVADNDAVIRIMFDFSEFESHNIAFESANYYDKQGNATLTARQAGFYKPVDHMYFDADEEFDRHMVFVDVAQQALFQQFKDSGAPGSYTAWLEAKVIAAQS